MKRSSKIALISTLLCCVQSVVLAQDTLSIDMMHQRVGNRWLFSTNPNAIQEASAPRLSIAEASYQRAKGGFVNYFESDNSYQYGALTESYYRINPQVMFYGKIAFNNFQGQNMAGSAFMNPYEASFDIQELADDTRGTKKKEQYLLTGGVSYKVSPKWTIGSKIHFESSNFTKTKDLRHFNKLLHMNANVGATYQATSRLKLGLNYDYDRRIESVGFNIYGNTDIQYLSLISFGNFWGRTELFTESGYTSATTPLTNFQHRVHGQIDIKLSERLQLLTELGYSTTSGYFGEKGTNSIVYVEHAGDGLVANATLSYTKKRLLQHLQIRMQQSSLQNDENVFRRETTTGGVSSIVYYGKNQVMNKNGTSLEARYNAIIKKENFQPNWLLAASIGYFQREITATLYPYFRKSNLSYSTITASAQKYLSLAHQRQLQVGATVSYRTGSGTPYQDGMYTNSGSQTQPTSRNSYLQQEFDYLTSSSMTITPKARYVFPVNPTLKGYIQGEYRFTNASKTIVLPQSFQQMTLTVGMQF